MLTQGLVSASLDLAWRVLALAFDVPRVRPSEYKNFTLAAGKEMPLLGGFA